MTQAADNPLSVLLSLETQTRAFEDINELFYFLVNEPYSLSPYRQAVLFDAHHKVVSLSGVANVERNTPFVQWLEQHIEDELDAPLCKPCLELGSDATDWLANHVLFLPVKTVHGRFYGTLLLSRDQDWTQAEISLLQHLMEASAYCWSHFMPRPQKKWTEHIPRKVKIAALIGCVLVLFFPVHLNVLAEAEIIAKDPVVIRAPMNGIVQEVTVHPNQDVTEGTSLVQMDVTDLENKKRIALKKLEGLRSEYRQTTRLALIDPKGKAKLVILAAQIKEQQANLNRLSNMIERAHIRAPHAATVILDDAQEWSAKPVQVGEKILSLADKDEIEIEAWLAVGDAIELKKDSELKLFLNASPLSAINGVINRISFKAQELPSGIMAHRIVATITQGKDVARLGAQGTARIEGERVSVFYWVFRRPIAVIRQFFGIQAMTQATIWQSLREDLDLHEGAPAYDGQPTWVIEDPATNRFFQLDRKGFEVLCRWHLGDAELIAQEINRETSQTISKEFVDNFSTFLIQNQLVSLPPGKSVEGLIKQRKKKQAWYLWLVHHYLFFRVPLVKPDGFLQATLKYVRPLYSKGVLYGLLFSLGAGLFLVSRQWDVFITSFVDMLSFQGFVYFIIALSISKIGHELGHAYTAKLYGCRVPAMGVAFLVLWPMLYTDTNQTWKIKSRRKRLNVGAAGMCVELGFAAIATLAWSFLPDGAWRDMALVTATTTWISSLLINISPFMRFDGYYLMSDWLGLPNLHQRSFALGRWKMREILFNLHHPVPERFKPKKQFFLILFAYGVWIYRLTLFLGIAVLVYSFFIKLIGILLFAIEILWFVLKPVYTELKVWYRIRDQIQQNKRGYIVLAVCFLLFGMAFIPWSTGVTASAIVKAGEATEIYSRFSGILQDRAIQDGQSVQTGDILARLQDPDLAQEEQALIYRKKRLEYEQTLTALSADYRGQSDSIYANLVQLDVEQNILYERKQSLMLKAPHSGIWLDSETGLSPGQWIGAGQHLGWLANFEQLKLNAYVLERDMQRINKQSGCLYYSLAAPQLRYECNIIEIENFPTRLLQQKELATINGGLITVRQDQAGFHPDESIYKVVLELGETDIPSIAHSGQVHLVGQAESLMLRLYRFVARTLIEESAW